MIKNMPNNIDINLYLMKNELLKILKISESYFEKEIQYKIIIPIYKKNKFYYYLKKDIFKLIEQREKTLKEYTKIKLFKDYYINIYGKVYSLRDNKLYPQKLKPKVDKDGYLSVCLFKDKQRYYKRINRLVAETFIPNPENKPEVNHKNGIVNDNYVENLEWVTISENIKHAYDSGLNYIGIENWKSRPVIAYKNNGEIFNVYENIINCANDIGIKESSVRSSSKNKTIKGRCGYYFRTISKQKYFELKGVINDK